MKAPPGFRWQGGRSLYVDLISPFTNLSKHPKVGFTNSLPPLLTLVSNRQKLIIHSLSKINGTSYIVILLYDDDMIITGNDKAVIHDLN